jgi:hydrogenase nickel incorporation protein HypB
MCATCGCSDTNPIHDGSGHDHEPHREHVSPGGPSALHDSRRSTISIEQDLLAHNDAMAHDNRRWFAERGVFAMNMLSSPGAGKTTLLERMIRDRTGGRPISVIEGDQATDLDARRIRAAGARAVQVNTGTGCHLDAAMVARAARELDLSADSTVAIENVGNLVCPALFDLGENIRLVVASVTEGEDKPSKYPHMFRVADAVVLNKTDLLPHVPFDFDQFLSHLRSINRRASVLRVSATLGDGLDALHRWLCDRIRRSGGEP